MEPKNALGRLCRDVLLNYSGICTRIDDFLYGCRTYFLQKPVEKDVNEKGVSVQEVCMEIVDDSVKGSIPINSYYPPSLLGKMVRDKITKRTGVCVARSFPFSGSPQYMFEYVPENTDKDPVMYIVDEARLEVIDSDRAINPADVQGKLPGGAPLFQTTRIVTL